jgi:hypothetical protein
MSGKVADLFQVANHGVRCEVAHHHVVDHPLAQRGDFAGGRNGLLKWCVVAHGEQQYPKTSPQHSAPDLSYADAAQCEKKFTSIAFPRSGYYNV